MEYIAFIFDLDGVIVSTDEYHYLAWKTIADQEGIKFDRKTNNMLRGVSRMASLDIILKEAEKKYSDEKKQQLADNKNKIYRQYLQNLNPKDMLPHVMEVLKYLRNAGYLLAVGSSSRNTRTILLRLGLGDYFDAVADGTEIKKSKPDPEVFLKAAEKLGVNPERCVVVEDATAGIEAAKRGNMLAIAINDAKNSPIADIRIDSMAEIIGLFPAINR